MVVSKDQIQELRERTGAAVMACKRALEKAGGNFEGALEHLKDEAVSLASEKQSRETKSGVIQGYVHGGRIGVLVELRSETDFVARNPEFQSLAKEIALQLAASSARNVSELLAEPYIRNPVITVGDFLKEAVGKFGENIEISRFSRLEL